MLAHALLAAAALAAAPDAASHADRLDQLLAESWQFDLRENPLWATHVGDHRFGDRLPRQTPADCQRRLAAKRALLARLESIDRRQLPPPAQINYDILARLLRDTIAEYEFQAHLVPITNRSGFHVDFPELRHHVPLATTADLENYVARLAAFGQYVDDHLELMRAGIECGIVPPDVVLAGSREAIEALLLAAPENSLFYEPLLAPPPAISDADVERLRAAARRAIAQRVVPGYRRLLDFLAREYLPACRGTVGASALPRGRDFYRHRVRKFTTLDLSPDDVHQMGLSEVARIRAEMQAVMRQVEFDGDLPAFVAHLRSEPRFYPATSAQLLQQVSHVLKQIDGRLPQLFGRLPRMPYGIREVPPYVAPRTTTAYYVPPAGDGTRAGFYYVNTFDLKSRPLFEVEALSLHEAVPGHHLQIALQQELENLPPLRRFAGFTAFVEGWALYAERLGLEMGFYDDPYSNFGRLSYEIWRACRLVVDTGIHHFGWTRQQAIDYMAANTALSLHNIAAEVDRYISWPGQALAYKVGELKIRQLRQAAEARLGPRFELRQFHDAVLSQGSVPLQTLEDQVAAWLDSVDVASPAASARP